MSAVLPATRYVYGPVPSRRLGRSLGVDLVPFKVCSYDCVYCQLGRTTTKTVERKAWVPLGEVLEVLLLEGVTAAASQVAKLADLVRRIAPARVQLNTVARPPAELFGRPVPELRLQALASLFPGRVDVLGAPGEGESDGAKETGTDPGEILRLLRRRPCTAGDVAEGLGIHRAEVLRHLDRLVAAGKVRSVVTGDHTFFAAASEKAGGGAPDGKGRE